MYAELKKNNRLHCGSIFGLVGFIIRFIFVVAAAAVLFVVVIPTEFVFVSWSACLGVGVCICICETERLYAVRQSFRSIAKCLFLLFYRKKIVASVD